MKRVSIVVSMISLALPAFSQGIITFDNRVVGQVIFHVYGPNTANSFDDLGLIGNGSDDYQSGTTSWAFHNPIGLNGTGGQFGGATTFAQLIAAPGSDQPEGSLVPASPVTTFRTGAAAGFVAPATAILANVAPDSAVATVEMVAWDNRSGLYTDWFQARAAWLSGAILAGESGRYNVYQIGGSLNTNPNLIGFQSFSLYGTPEPSTVALIAIGATAILILRRRQF